MNCRVPVAKLRRRRWSDLPVDKLTFCQAVKALASLWPACAIAGLRYDRCATRLRNETRVRGTSSISASPAMNARLLEVQVPALRRMVYRPKS